MLSLLCLPSLSPPSCQSYSWLSETAASAGITPPLGTPFFLESSQPPIPMSSSVSPSRNNGKLSDNGHREGGCDLLLKDVQSSVPLPPPANQYLGDRWFQDHLWTPKPVDAQIPWIPQIKSATCNMVQCLHTACAQPVGLLVIPTTVERAVILCTPPWFFPSIFDPELGDPEGGATSIQRAEWAPLPRQGLHPWT